MGKQCPKCNRFLPITANVFKDLGNGQKSDEIIANKLECGHMVGGEAYNKFLDASEAAQAEADKAFAAAQKMLDDKRAALSKSFLFS